MFFRTLTPFVPLLKGLTLLAVAAVLGSLYRLYGLGRALAASQSAFGIYDSDALARHPSMIKWLIYSLIGAVVLIELQVRLASHPYGSIGLLCVHLAVIFAWLVLLLVIVRRYTGKKFPRTHRALVYASLGLFAVILITGGMLYWPFWVS